MRFLESGDVYSRIAAEQLVDGMDITEEWCEHHLEERFLCASGLASDLVHEKRLRMDDFSENKVTCFIRDVEEKALVRNIPGYA